MFVGIGRFEIFIPASASLKEKRFVVKSLKQRIQNKFNVSVSEVGELEKWQRASLGIALVTNEMRLIDQTFDKIRQLVESRVEVQVIDASLEVY